MQNRSQNGNDDMDKMKEFIDGLHLVLSQWKKILIT